MNLSTKIITESYQITDDDCYIGVKCDKPVILTLPAKVDDGRLIIIKAEMKPPMGNKTITIVTRDGSTIDGYINHTIQVSHDFVHLIYHNNAWHIV